MENILRKGLLDNGGHAVLFLVIRYATRTNFTWGQTCCWKYIGTIRESSTHVNNNLSQWLGLFYSPKKLPGIEVRKDDGKYFKSDSYGIIQ